MDSQEGKNLELDNPQDSKEAVEDAQTATTDSNEESTITTPEKPIAESGNNPSSPTSAQKKPSKTKIAIIAGVIAVVVVAAICGSLFLTTSGAASEVINKANKIGEVTLESGPAIEEAEKAYDALAWNEQIQVNIHGDGTLEKARDSFDALIAGRNDNAIADAISAIDQIGKVSLDSNNAIDTAKNAIELCDEYGIADQVSNKEVFDAAEAELLNLKISDAESKINAIGKVTLKSKNAIHSARSAILSIPTDQRDKISNYDVFKKADKTFDNLLKEKAKQDSINEARHTIKINGIKVTPNFIGNNEMTVSLTNKSNKTIKYVHFNVDFYNTVNDRLEYRTPYSHYEITGPIAPGASNDSNVYWLLPLDIVHTQISRAKMNEIDVVFTDGTSIELDKDQIAVVQK